MSSKNTVNTKENNLTEVQTKERARKRLGIHGVLSILVLLVMVRQFMMGNWHNVFICVLTILLFMIPTIVDRRFNIKMPALLEGIILFFIFAAEIMGEIQSFYTIIPIWDTMLHTINGFIMAAIGFAMIDILNRSPRIHITMSPWFVAFVTFCFSMTVGVVWEFFEFSMDFFTSTDMQKDWLVGGVSSVLINPSGLNNPILIKDITKTVISGTIDGAPQDWVINGAYLDIGIIDTMKDLIVNCIGAVVFSIFGFLYIKARGKGSIVTSLIPKLKTEQEIEETKRMLDEKKKKSSRK